ncbi:MAG: caspase family protein [bacterium]
MHKFFREQTAFWSILLALLVIVPGSLAWSESAPGGSRSVLIRVKGEDGAPKEVQLYKGSYALLIGVSNYTAGWPKLPGVLQDIEDVEKTLKSQGFEITVLKDPDSVHLVSGIKDFINRYGLEQENRLLIYFAGHGHTEKLAYGDEMGYIVPSDAPNPNVDKKGFKAKALDMQQFESFARIIESKHALFVFDSCFSGSLFAITRAIPEAISYKTSRPVRQFMTSGSADEAVPDKSVFKSQFIEGIGGEADSDKDGFVTGTELGNFLESRVVNYSNGCQHPQYGKIREQNLDKGDFVFQPGGKTPGEGKEQPRPPVTPEISATPAPSPEVVSSPPPGESPSPEITISKSPEPVSVKEGKVHPSLGATVKITTPDLARRLNVPCGLLITFVSPGSLAEKAGLMRGDILVKIERQRINNLEDLRKVLTMHKKGEPLSIVIYRNKRLHFLKVGR